MDSDATDVVAALLDLAGVQASADVDAEHADVVADGPGAVDGPDRPVETPRAVAGRLDESTPVALQLRANHVVVGVEHLSPSVVAEPGRMLR